CTTAEAPGPRGGVYDRDVLEAHRRVCACNGLQEQGSRFWAVLLCGLRAWRKSYEITGPALAPYPVLRNGVAPCDGTRIIRAIHAADRVAPGWQCEIGVQFDDAAVVSPWGDGELVSEISLKPALAARYLRQDIDRH